MNAKLLKDVMVDAPFLRSGFNYDRSVASNASGLKCEDVSLARQSEAQDADINEIVRRFGITGQLPSNVRVPSFGDFSGITSFHEAMNVVAEAQEAFMLMPAEVRSRFKNDPEQFLDFVYDEDNRAEAEKLGLVLPKVEVLPDKPVEVVVVTPEPGKAPKVP